MEDYTIRLATADDSEELCEIYAYYVNNTALTFEYKPPTPAEFSIRISESLRKYPYLVIEDEDSIAGFAFARAFRERPAYDFAAETTIYLHHNKRHQGFGSLLYSVLEHELGCMGIKSLYACVAVSDNNDERLNEDSPRFHSTQGFQNCGLFRNCGYKFDRWYSITWMEKIIGEFSDNPIPVTLYPELISKNSSIMSERLSEYNEKAIRLITERNEVFFGEALHFPEEYGMHEFNNEEEGLQIGSYVFFKSEIRGITELMI